MPLAAPADVHAQAAANRAESAIVVAMNAERARYGLPRLRLSRALSGSAKAHTIDMLRHDSLSHNSSDGTQPGVRIARATGAHRSGETIAWAQRGAGSGARTIIRMWMTSPGHRALILSRSFRRVGVGRAFGKLGSSAGLAVTADFASAR
jgi:uncharacterized protein YkwD